MKKFIGILYMFITLGYLRIILNHKNKQTYFLKYELKFLNWCYNKKQNNKINHFKSL